MRVALNRPAHVHIETRDYDGTLTAATGNVAVVVKDLDETIVQSGNAVAGQHGHDAGVYVFALSPSTVLDTLGVYTLTATFTVGTDAQTITIPIEVVGNHLFEIHELRAFDPALADDTRYTAEEIRIARDYATERLEEAAQVALTTRLRRIVIDGSGISSLVLPDTEVTNFISATNLEEETGVDTEDDLTATELLDVEAKIEGILVRTDGNDWTYGVQNWIIEYEHGIANASIWKRPAMILAVEALVRQALPYRATSQSTDLGEFRISVANPSIGRDTGIPEVDAIIHNHGRRRPVVG